MKYADVVMKTLELFHAGPCTSSESNTGIVLNTQYGYVTYRTDCDFDLINEFFKQKRLSGQDLNKSFYKSWETVMQLDTEQRIEDQILHYLSTYGTDFIGEPFIPLQDLDVPELKKTSLMVIQVLDNEQLMEKCINMLDSGVALKQETVTDLVGILTHCGFPFHDGRQFRNREANLFVIQETACYPLDPNEFLRYVVFRITGETQLIKNKDLLRTIRVHAASPMLRRRYNPRQDFLNYGLHHLGQIFNRQKPFFMAMKPFCPDVINRITKLSKTRHKPMKENPLNRVTAIQLSCEDEPQIRKATTFALIRAMNACLNRRMGADLYVYNIRNGTVWIDQKRKRVEQLFSMVELLDHNIIAIEKELQSRFEFMNGKTAYVDPNVILAVPVSEKNFVGNLPMGTKVSSKNLTVGIYWRNEWGARDLDLSGISIYGDKVGWDGAYTDETLTYSGDMTNAVNGAVEYLRSTGHVLPPTLLYVNVYSGADEGVKYRILIGDKSKISTTYVMDPNQVILEVETTTLKKQSVLGFMKTINNGEEHQQTQFTLIGSAMGNRRASVDSSLNLIGIQALEMRWENALTMPEFLQLVGVELVEEKNDADFDFSVDNLTKDGILEFMAAK